MTYALREARDLAVSTLPALIARIIAFIALAALGLSGEPFHDPFHARSAGPEFTTLTAVPMSQEPTRTTPRE